MGTEELATIITKGLTEKVNLTNFNNTVEAQTVFDSLSHRYSLFHVGWIDEHRVFGCVLHIEIKQDKVWIHWDGNRRWFYYLLGRT